MKEVAPAATDEEILALAADGSYLLISFDKDMGELIVRREMRQAAGVILFRTVMPSPDAAAAFIAGVIGSRDDWEGHLSVVDETKIRMRRL